MNVQQELIEIVASAAKPEGNGVHFVYLTGIGACSVEKITYDELERVVNDLR